MLLLELLDVLLAEDVVVVVLVVSSPQPAWSDKLARKSGATPSVAVGKWVRRRLRNGMPYA